MTSVLRYASQLLCYGLFGATIAYFSVAPEYRYDASDQAVVKLSFSHAAQRIAPCVQLSPEEVAALAPNMRRTESCVRQRLPLEIEMAIDGDLVLAQQVPPSGLWGDGPASVYEKRALAPGKYVISLRLRESDNAEHWDYTHTETVELSAGRYLTITFKAENGGFRIR